MLDDQVPNGEGASGMPEIPGLGGGGDAIPGLGGGGDAIPGLGGGGTPDIGAVAGGSSVSGMAQDAVRMAQAAKQGDAGQAADAAVDIAAKGTATYFGGEVGGKAAGMVLNSEPGKMAKKGIIWVVGIVVGALVMMTVSAGAAVVGSATVASGGSAGLANCLPGFGGSGSTPLEDPTPEQVVGAIYAQVKGYGYGDYAAAIAIASARFESTFVNKTIGDKWVSSGGMTGSRGIYQQFPNAVPAKLAWSGKPDPGYGKDYSMYNDKNAWGPNGWAAIDPRMNVPQAVNIFVLGMGAGRPNSGSGYWGLDSPLMPNKAKLMTNEIPTEEEVYKGMHYVQGFNYSSTNARNWARQSYPEAMEWVEKVRRGEIPIPAFVRPLDWMKLRADSPETRAIFNGSAAATTPAPASTPAPSPTSTRRPTPSPTESANSPQDRLEDELRDNLGQRSVAGAAPQTSDAPRARSREANGDSAEASRSDNQGANRNSTPSPSPSPSRGGGANANADTTTGLVDAVDNDGILFIGDSVMEGLLQINAPPKVLYGGPAVRNYLQGVNLQQVLTSPGDVSASTGNRKQNMAEWRENIKNGPSRILVQLGTNPSSMNNKNGVAKFMDLAGPGRQVYWFAPHYEPAVEPMTDALNWASAKYGNLTVIPVKDLLPKEEYGAEGDPNGMHPYSAYTKMWERALTVMSESSGAIPEDISQEGCAEQGLIGGAIPVSPGASSLPHEDKYQTAPGMGWSVNLEGGRNMVYYSQCDERWPAAASYNFCGCACGTTSMAMVIATLAGAQDYTPVHAYRRQKELGGIYGTCGTVGGVTSVFPRMGEEFNIPAQYIGTNWQKVDETLRKGGLIIASMVGGTPLAPGGGHLIVIRGKTADGRYLVADPGNRSFTVAYAWSQSQFVFNQGMAAFLPMGSSF